VDDLINIHDLFHAGEIGIAVAILWVQQKAMQRWAERHEKRDDERFDQHQERLDEIADRVKG
jgi:hypothetical protein